jgi:putative phosphoesterase
MIVGVISDTHDKLQTIDLAFDSFMRNGVELVIHCGDWKKIETLRYFAECAARSNLAVRGVLGNNDTDVDAFLKEAERVSADFELTPLVLRMNIEGKNISVHHGHIKSILKDLQNSTTTDILFLGHSHKPLIKYENSQLIVNPGSTAFSIPRSTSWKPSVAIVDTAKTVNPAQIVYL